MLGFLSRLFGRGTTSIKDPYLGKLRYLDSENGKVWAGHVGSRDQHEAVDFFIESPEKLLRHESRNNLLDVLENYHDIKSKIVDAIEVDLPNLVHGETTVQFVHIPELNQTYEAEFICASQAKSFSALIKNRILVELIPHDN